MMAIISLLIVAAIIAFAFFLAKPLGEKLLNGKRGNMIFRGYLILLVIGALVSNVIPVDSSFKGEIKTDTEVKKANEQDGAFFRMVHEGKIDEAEGAMKAGEWEFDFEGEGIRVPNSGSQYMPVVVEIKDEDDGKIEVAYYVSRAFIENIDVTEEITPPEVDIVDSVIRILPPPAEEIKIAKVTQPYPFTQFHGGNNPFEEEHRTYLGQEVIYLKVPKGVKVDGYMTIVDS
ncbi:hypothetical protein ACOJQI_02220 [Bacillus salacetis]|uniref:hypothetical protein n=1 Tax=Bacillus salacetis TaxID=2315464 RepID=UPI003B9EE4DE